MNAHTTRGLPASQTSLAKFSGAPLSAFGTARYPHSVNRPISDRPFVSIVVPCRNEARYIGPCIESLTANDYPADSYEILVVDGMSSDGSRECIADMSDQYAMVRLLDNHAGITPVAMNLGIVSSRGEIIVIAGAHNQYDSTFLRRVVDHLARCPEADAVGGVIVTKPRTGDRVGRAIAQCLSHPFGVGPSHFRTIPHKPVWVDAAFGCGYRRNVFERIGLFNERLIRGQDMELNLRLRAAGGRILLAPDLTSSYFARSTFGSFWAHNFSNGEWAVLPFLRSPIRPVGLRHLVPLAFVLALILTGLAAAVLPVARWAAIALTVAYTVPLLAAAVHVAVRSRDPLYLPIMVLIFPSMHFGYGLGSLWGGLQVVVRWLLGERRPRPEDAWPRLDQ